MNLQKMTCFRTGVIMTQKIGNLYNLMSHLTELRRWYQYSNRLVLESEENRLKREEEIYSPHECAYTNKIMRQKKKIIDKFHLNVPSHKDSKLSLKIPVQSYGLLSRPSYYSF